MINTGTQRLAAVMAEPQIHPGHVGVQANAKA